MRRPRPDGEITFTERVTMAFVAVVAALVTLALYPVALILLTPVGGGSGRIAAAAYFYGFMLSNVGIAIIVTAGVAGFWLGSARMANIFSFFWGTHPCWKRFRFWLHDREERLETEHDVPLTALVALLLVVIAFAIWKYSA